MARVLVTGADGFIGTHVVKALDGHEVTTFDMNGYRPAPSKPFDGIIHLAAVSRVKDAEADRIKCLDTNILLTAKMLEWNPRWFIFASTCEKPTNIYGFSKRAAEDYIKLRCKKYIIYRLANVYGTGMAEDKLIPSVKAGAAIPDHVLPFEHIQVEVVVQMIRQVIPKFDDAEFKSFTLKLATGVAKTKEQLRDVAASY